MSDKATSIVDEIRSLERKADQLCTIHAWLRDRYKFRAAFLDYGLLGGTIYLLGLSLVEPAIGIPLSFGCDRQVLIAVSSLIVFFFSVVQLKSDWKTNAEAHHRAMKEYADIKSDCRAVTSGTRSPNSPELDRIKSRYSVVTDVGTHIPDGSFVNGKAHHLRKVFVSKYLDGCYPPSAQLRH
jgi:hypothetical protein